MHGPHRPYVSRRQFIRRASTVGIATAAGPWIWKGLAYADEAPVEQIHVELGADAAREAQFTWMTPAAVTAPFLQLGSQRIAATTQQYDGYPGFFHKVRVTDLLPATTYTYGVGQADAVQRDGFSYTTGPSGRTSFSFTAFADQGTDFVGGEPSIEDVDPATLTTIAKGADQQPPFQATANRELAYSFAPAFHVVGGDTSYANGNQAVWDEWFRGYEAHATTRPIVPCIGNHEIESAIGIGGFSATGDDSWGPLGYDAYRTRFSLPSNGDRDWEGNWFRFRYGSVEFISIDNNDVNTEVTANIGYSEGRQQAWVERVLRAAHEDDTCDFIIVIMHQAAFSTGLHGSDQGVRDAWFGAFSRYGVDLVLQGHDHQWERTHLMDRDEVVLSSDGTYATDLGTMYIVCGNGGAVQRPQNPLPNQFDWQANKSVFTVGTVKVDVEFDEAAGVKRLTLGEHSVTTGMPIEEGIVIERTMQPAATSTASGAPDPATDNKATAVLATADTVTPDPLLAATGGPAGTTLLSVAALGMAGSLARARYRGAHDDELVERQARRTEAGGAATRPG